MVIFLFPFLRNDSENRPFYVVRIVVVARRSGPEETPPQTRAEHAYPGLGHRVIDISPLCRFELVHGLLRRLNIIVDLCTGPQTYSGPDSPATIETRYAIPRLSDRYASEGQPAGIDLERPSRCFGFGRISEWKKRAKRPESRSTYLERFLLLCV